MMASDWPLFARGYLLTEAKLDTLSGQAARYVREHWQRRRVGSLYVHTDPRLPVCVFAKQNVSLLLIGRVLDPIGGLETTDEVLTCLHGRFLASNERFFDYLDGLTGRFLLVVLAPQRRFLLHDAAGIRSAAYDHVRPGVWVSSHTQLLAELAGRERSEAASELIATAAYQANVRHLPGVLTPYPGIRLLTPNTLLDLDTKTVERYYPRAPRVARRLSAELVDELAHLFSKQVEMLHRHSKLSVSLTGGIDSRLTLAATRPIKDSAYYFTYVAEGCEQHDRDAAQARKIAARLRFRTHVIRAPSAPTSCEEEEFLGAFRRSTAYMRNDSLGLIAQALMEELPADHLHLKSNVSETARTYYRKGHHDLPKAPDEAAFARVYEIEPERPFCLDAFGQFLRLVDFPAVTRLGHDPYDFFYWEHRMGCWQSLQVLDFDIAHDTFVLYNNRVLLEKMLSVPLEARRKGLLHRQVIRRLWPKAARIPLNPWGRTPGTAELKVRRALRKLLGPRRWERLRRSFGSRRARAAGGRGHCPQPQLGRQRQTEATDAEGRAQGPASAALEEPGRGSR